MMYTQLCFSCILGDYIDYRLFFFFFLHVAFTEKKSQMSGCYMLKTQLLYAAPSMAAFRNKQEGSVYIVFLHT